ncbi:MAG: hypothetical protein JXB26_18395 [Candidatus Aminicenantes bacterium]|nr:hypothetical protein [Candidatus Aminicenantes bacterium]
METILSVLSGGASGALLVWILRKWISERLKQSIRYEYSQKLESHKAELNSRIEEIKHENELLQLRTSLFFDHQRNAFASLLAKIASVNQKWLDEGYNEDVGLTGPVPYETYKDLMATYYEHQLFLDAQCLAAMELIFDYYTDSFPYDDGLGEPPKSRDIEAAYAAVEYLQPRLAELFQSRIGVMNGKHAERDIALLGAIRLLNLYHFTDVDLPPKDALMLTHNDRPSDAVAKAEDNISELVGKLHRFQIYLRRKGGFFNKAALKTSRYLSMLHSYYPDLENWHVNETTKLNTS